MLLYPGEPRPPSEIWIMDVVKSLPGGGHATVDSLGKTEAGGSSL